MINFKEIPDGETWELFARDFLQENGFYIESTVDRGADGKKDLIVSEHLKGNLGNYKFTWLVSCKHNAQSERSVSEADEPNILERVRDFKCDGFIGFYSTIPSSGLNSRLNHLKSNKDIKDYRVFDYKLIENYLIRIGYSFLLIRYFPESYKNIKPLHLITDEYVPLECENCGKDILIEMYKKHYKGLIAFVYERKNSRLEVKDIYFACKGECDRRLRNKYHMELGLHTLWEDIGDLVIPFWFLRYINSLLNNIQTGFYLYEEEAFSKQISFIIALSQKVFREMTKDEKDRVKRLLQLTQFMA